MVLSFTNHNSRDSCKLSCLAPLGEGGAQAVATFPKVTQERVGATRGQSAGLAFTSWCPSSFPPRVLFGFSFGGALSWSFSKTAAASSSERSRTSTGSSSQSTGLSTSTLRKVNFFVYQQFIVADVCFCFGDQTLLQSQVFLLLDREGIVQMRGSTADTCTCYSLEGIRFYGPLVSGGPLSGVCSVRAVQNGDSMRVNFRIVSVFCLRGATVETHHASVLGFFW